VILFFSKIIISTPFADGSFDINIRDTNLDGSGRERTELRMRIEQRKTDPITGESYQPVL